jgi:hypothetical protein
MFMRGGLGSNHHLLLGAGFSRNWGGLLADEVVDFLLSSPELSSDAGVRDIIWTNSDAGFESALEQVQRDFRANPKSRDACVRLERMQSAISRMFQDMNEGFYNELSFESHSNRTGTVREFLTRFETIFTLNQDLLLEHHYKDNYDISLESPHRWNGLQIPGMRRLPADEPLFDKSWARARWLPLPDTEYQVDEHCQPYFKLHGSCNWIASKGEPILIIGGGKEESITNYQILRRYFAEFVTRVCQPNARLVVIGCGFKDHHINKVIAPGVYEYGLKLFVIAPKARDLAKVLTSSVHGGASMAVYGYDLEDIFRKGVAGVSQRPLRETFGSDVAELKKVNRFFETE